jgi:hypothetical protein
MSVYGVSFRTLLIHHITLNRLTHAEIGKAVGRTQSGVTQVVLGKVKPPLDDLDLWANALRLAGSEREKFIKLAHLSHVSDYTANMIHELERTLEQQGDQIRRLQAAVTRLEGERAGQGRDSSG